MHIITDRQTLTDGRTDRQRAQIDDIMMTIQTTAINIFIIY